MIIPDHNFVPLLLIHKHDNIGLVHHLNQSYIRVQVLHLLFGSSPLWIVLQDFEPSRCGHSEIFLGLVRWDKVYSRLLLRIRVELLFLRLIMGQFEFVYHFLIYDTINSFNHIFFLSFENVAFVLLFWHCCDRLGDTLCSFHNNLLGLLFNN